MIENRDNINIFFYFLFIYIRLKIFQAIRVPRVTRVFEKMNSNNRVIEKLVIWNHFTMFGDILIKALVTNF